MYAVFQSGGKQHRVSEGQTLRLEKLDVETGATVEFDKVLLVANGEDIKVGVAQVENQQGIRLQRRQNLRPEALIVGLRVRFVPNVG